MKFFFRFFSRALSFLSAYAAWRKMIFRAAKNDSEAPRLSRKNEERRKKLNRFLLFDSRAPRDVALFAPRSFLGNRNARSS